MYINYMPCEAIGTGFAGHMFFLVLSVLSANQPLACITKRSVVMLTPSIMKITGLENA